MNAVACPLEVMAAVGDQPSVPFSTVYITLTKQEHIQLVLEANSWKDLHRRAAERAKWNDRRQQHEVLELKQEAARRAEAVSKATAKRWGALRRRVAARNAARDLRWQHELREVREQAARAEAALRAELEVAQAKVRDLQKRLFGRKSEKRNASEAQAPSPAARASRGHRRGAPGHGRTMAPHLPARPEVVALDDPECPSCGRALGEFPGTEDSEVLEIEVQAYRRVIRRKRYRPLCDCGCVPGIVTAPAPARLIERGKYGVSVWTTVLLDKFLYGRPSNRLLQDLADHGLSMSPGTLAGGLQALLPLFEPLNQALVSKLRSESHWHADETRWAVFVTMEGKVGHRWYLWVFHSPSVVHYVLDPTRAAKVVQGELGERDHGIISCDRYSAYKKFARLNPGVLLAFCWSHQRRNFLELGNSHPHLLAWATGWVEAIGAMYHLNALRIKAELGSAERAGHHAALEQAVQAMADAFGTALAEALLAGPALKVMQSMKNHWLGLTVFVEHPWVPMDNNKAERAVRQPVVGRKSFYGSGALWAGQLAATTYSLLMTVKLWGLNARTWLSQYLQACADNGNRASADLDAFIPWAMDEARLATLRAGAAGIREAIDTIESIDTS
jgi:transposase